MGVGLPDLPPYRSLPAYDWLKLLLARGKSGTIVSAERHRQRRPGEEGRVTPRPPGPAFRPRRFRRGGMPCRATPRRARPGCAAVPGAGPRGRRLAADHRRARPPGARPARSRQVRDQSRRHRHLLGTHREPREDVALGRGARPPEPGAEVDERVVASRVHVHARWLARRSRALPCSRLPRAQHGGPGEPVDDDRVAERDVDEFRRLVRRPGRAASTSAAARSRGAAETPPRSSRCPVTGLVVPQQRLAQPLRVDVDDAETDSLAIAPRSATWLCSRSSSSSRRPHQAVLLAHLEPERALDGHRERQARGRRPCPR